MCQLTRREKANIRKRDAKYIKLTGQCILCGNTDEPTSRHHLFYDKEKFNRAAVIEVCDTCDCKIHKRDDNDNWVAKLKGVRSIKLLNSNEKDKYIINVEDKNVGYGYKTPNGIKLIIVD